MQVKNRLNRAGAIPDLKQGCCVSVGKDLTCHFFVKQFYHLQELPEQTHTHTHTHTWIYCIIIIVGVAGFYDSIKSRML